MSKNCLRCTVSGKVQGVWYRASAQKQALISGISGWIRNLPDGRVEALICGDEVGLKEMQAWLAKGPLLANVTAVEVEEANDEGDEIFRVID
jgi:acylphosphatase